MYVVKQLHSRSAPLFSLVQKTGFLMMQPILNLIKALGRPEIVNIICTFNLSKSANHGCHSQEKAYVVVATKMLRKQKRRRF